MITYRERTTEEDFYDVSMHCNYCGKKLTNPGEYCSGSCEQKDSVWHREDEI